MRSQWLARKLWLVAVAEGALISWRHWRRLEPKDRSRLLALAKKSKGRPGTNLSARERREASDLLDKMGHIELAGSLAGIALPFRPLSKLATRVVESRHQRSRAARSGDGDVRVLEEGHGGVAPVEGDDRPSRVGSGTA
jgi:hypothetical protein